MTPFVSFSTVYNTIWCNSLKNRTLFNRAELTIKDNKDVIVANKVFDKENMALRGLKITWVCIAVLFNSCSIIL